MKEPSTWKTEVHAGRNILFDVDRTTGMIPHKIPGYIGTDEDDSYVKLNGRDFEVSTALLPHNQYETVIFSSQPEISSQFAYLPNVPAFHRTRDRNEAIARHDQLVRELKGEEGSITSHTHVYHN